MIVKMKKVAVVIREKTRKESLKALRKAGLMHIERDNGAGTSPEELNADAALLQNALLALPTTKNRKLPENPVDKKKVLKDAQEIVALKNKEKELLDKKLSLAADREVLEPWGDFEPADLRILAAKGIDIRLVEVDDSMLESYVNSNDCEFLTLGKKKKSVLGAAIYRNGVPEDAEHGITLPEYGLSEIAELEIQIEQERREIGSALATWSQEAGPIEYILASLKQDIEFEEVKNSLAEEEQLAWFTGFIPEDATETFKALAADQAWGIMITEPSPDDDIPTLVRNKPAIRIIQPVFDLMNIFPGYREPDISLWFLMFLSFFTGMIIGDAGYGVITLALVLVFRIKSGKSSNALKLFTIFGVMTLIWGALTGTWFASLPLVRDTPLRKLVIPAIATYQQELFPDYTMIMGIFPNDSIDATIMVQWISLLFGAVMLTIARIQNFIMKLPSIKALAQIGWLSIVLAMYWLIMRLVLQLQPLPFLMDLVIPMVVGGLILVFLFENQEKGRSFFKGVIESLKGLLPMILDVIGAFGDIVSYIRLFAVGLAGVALSQSFNSMAPKGGGFTIVLAVLILVVGHSLNYILCALSVLVHGVRLNVLEFSGHLDIEWAGFAFEPFRLRVPELESPEIHKEIDT